MTSTATKLCLALALSLPVLVLVQAPVSLDLVTARRAYLTSDNVDRRWLDRLAQEFTKTKRFVLVASEAEADVVATLARGKGTTVGIPVAGVMVAAENEAFRLRVTKAGTGELLWDDYREASVTIGGAVSGMVKRLHQRLILADGEARELVRRQQPPQTK